jgi:hypothetical protein
VFSAWSDEIDPGRCPSAATSSSNQSRKATIFGSERVALGQTSQ